MEKKRLSGILAKCGVSEIKELAEPLMEKYPVSVLRRPAKTMVLIRMKETVARADFYLGELLAVEAMVEMAGAKGFALLAGDDPDKALYTAVIDAAVNSSLGEREDILRRLEEKETQQQKKEMLEIAMHTATRVKFETLDSNE